MLAVLGSAASSCRAIAGSASVVADAVVVDEATLMVPSTRAYLDKLMQQLERTTGIKVRVICPPLGMRQNMKQWTEFMRPLMKSLRLDANSVVIVADQKIDPRSGRLVSLLNMSMGSVVQQRFQYYFNNDFIESVANRFGSRSYVEAKGTDTAIRDAAENIVAALYSLVDSKPEAQNRSFFTKPWYRSYVPVEDVAAILGRHAV